MKRWLGSSLLAMGLSLGVCLPAMAFEMTPAVQADLDRYKTMAAGWAQDPVVVKAVQEQNAKGPLADMDNAKWKSTRRSDPVVKSFQENAAGRFLASKMVATSGAVTEAFLNGSKGEKVAFVEKTTSYVHVGQPKFDVPYGKGTPWQGKPEFDESTQVYAIQVSVPVLADGKPVGALVVGVNLTYLEKTAKR